MNALVPVPLPPEVTMLNGVLTWPGVVVITIGAGIALVKVKVTGAVVTAA